METSPQRSASTVKNWPVKKHAPANNGQPIKFQSGQSGRSNNRNMKHEEIIKLPATAIRHGPEPSAWLRLTQRLPNG